jgi:hypothetical protein
MQRRLSAILAADVAGYSGLMEADEAGTLLIFSRSRNRSYPHNEIKSWRSKT